MIPAGVCLVIVLVAAYRRVWGKEPPLDGEEIRILRRHADRLRHEQMLPLD